MKRKITLVIFLIILIGFIIVITNEQNERQTPLVCSEYSSECVNFAVETNNASICSNFNDSFRQSTCVSSIAVNTSNSSLCEQVTHGFGVKSSCYLRVARSSHNFSLCDNIEEIAYLVGCLEAKAIFEDSYAICYSIEHLNDSFFSKISNKDYYQERCLKTFFKTKDMNYCTAILNDTLNQLCNISVNYVEPRYK